jgi:hypothetical protein
MRRRLADVADEIVGPFDVGDHLEQGNHLTQVAGNRSLQRQDPVAVLFQVEGAGVDLVVAWMM